MTIEEKLEHCVKFIEKVERIDIETSDEDAVEVFRRLKDTAWHVLAELAE